MNFFVYTASVLVKKSKNHRNGSGIIPFSYSKCGRTVDLAIAYWKKQIVLCPNINDNNKEWCKEFVETMVKKELRELKMELRRVVTERFFNNDWHKSNQKENQLTKYSLKSFYDTLRNHLLYFSSVFSKI